MKVITKKIKLNRLDYYIRHLNIINTMLPIQLTQREIEVLGGFMSLTGDLKKDPFSSLGRKLVMEKVGIKNMGGLGNFLNQLKQKGFIKEKDNTLTIIPLIIPNEDEQEYNFKIILEND